MVGLPALVRGRRERRGDRGRAAAARPADGRVGARSSDDVRVHVIVGVVGLALVALMLTEYFVVLLLPRRVKRDPRVARQFYAIVWPAWRALARRMSPRAGDAFLGVFGPFGFLAMLGLLALGLLVGFAAMHWGLQTRFGAAASHGFGDDVYYSAGMLFSASTGLNPVGTLSHALAVGEAAVGFLVLATVIGYLPALFQAFSRREVAVSQLDPRAGSPPSAGRLISREVQLGDWERLDEYLRDWQVWAAELMETHLSYPVLTYYRSQHVNQNWLAALTCVVDASAFVIAGAPSELTEGASLTYAVGRHALADLASALRAAPRREHQDRLSAEAFEELYTRVSDSGLELAEREEMAARLHELRGGYEPHALALARRLELGLPSWLPADEDVKQYWKVSGAH